MKQVIWLLVVVAVVLCFGTLFYRAATTAHTHQIAYDTYISIVLTAVAVILAALAIFIGLAAIWGYQQISSQAELKAEKAAGEHIAKLLTDERVQQMVRAELEAQKNLVWQAMIAESQAKSSSDDDRTVANPYPETTSNESEI